MKSRLLNKTFFILLLNISFQLYFSAELVDKFEIKNNFVEKDVVLPPDFGKDGTILVIMLEDKNSYDNFLKKIFTSNYKGECVFIRKTELSMQCRDREKYRYYFTCTGAASGRVDNNLKEYYIFDRVEGIRYSFNENIRFTSKALTRYADMLEKKRLSVK